MSRRVIAQVCVDILQSLLPDDELDLKATATQISAIEFRDGSTADSERVKLATHCLEEELKLITGQLRAPQIPIIITSLTIISSNRSKRG